MEPTPKTQQRRSRLKSSKYRGVSKCSKDGRWQARIRVGKVVKYLGRFCTQEEAAEAYDRGALRYHSHRAVTNFDRKLYDVPPLSTGEVEAELAEAAKKKIKRRRRNPVQESPTPPVQIRNPVPLIPRVQPNSPPLQTQQPGMTYPLLAHFAAFSPQQQFALPQLHGWPPLGGFSMAGSPLMLHQQAMQQMAKVEPSSKETDDALGSMLSLSAGRTLHFPSVSSQQSPNNAAIQE